MLGVEARHPSSLCFRIFVNLIVALEAANALPNLALKLCDILREFLSVVKESRSFRQYEPNQIDKSNLVRDRKIFLPQEEHERPEGSATTIAMGYQT